MRIKDGGELVDIQEKVDDIIELNASIKLVEEESK